jgi:hypothetical protein
VGDPVCDYDPAASELTATDLAIHTAYAPAATGAHAWGAPLYQLVMNAAVAPTADVSLSANGG